MASSGQHNAPAHPLASVAQSVGRGPADDADYGVPLATQLPRRQPEGVAPPQVLSLCATNLSAVQAWLGPNFQHRLAASDVPGTFGPDLVASVMELWSNDELQARCSQLRLPLPVFAPKASLTDGSLEAFVEQVQADSAVDEATVENLSAFVSGISELKAGQWKEWLELVDRHCTRPVLGRVGPEAAAASLKLPFACRSTCLCDCFDAFELHGTVAGFIGFFCAVQGVTSADVHATDLRHFVGRRPQWIPSHLVLSARREDSLPWLVTQGWCAPSALLQLPAFAEFQQLAEHFDSVTTYFDREAGDCQGIREHWGTTGEDLHILSAREARVVAGLYKRELGRKYRSPRRVPEDAPETAWAWLLQQDMRGIWSIVYTPESPEARSPYCRVVACHACRLPEEVTSWKMKRLTGNYFSQLRNGTGHPDRPPVWSVLDPAAFQLSRGQPRCHCGSEASKDGLTVCEGHCMREVSQCPQYLEALDFVENICPELLELLQPAFNRCFCWNCSQGSGEFMVESVGGQDVEVPVPCGWVSLSLAVPELDMWSWPVSYHGTTPQRCLSILRSGHIGMPGDQLPDGSLLEAKNTAHQLTAPEFASSLSLAYAGLQLYATAQPWDWGEKAGQVVLQCRQDCSQLRRKQAETVGFLEANFDARGLDPKFDIYDPASGIEMFSDQADRCVPYRVLVRTFDHEHPPDRTRHPQGLETFRCDRDSEHIGKFRKDYSRFY